MAVIIKTLKNKLDTILPRTSTSAVSLPDGSNLEDKLIFLTDAEMLPNPIYVQADEVEIADTGGNFTSTDVEGALGELIPQSGSGANGSWVKFPDGTMICTIKKIIDVTTLASNVAGSSSGTAYFGTGLWTFPETFISPPVVTSSSNQPTMTGFFTKSRDLSATTVTLSCFHPISTTGAEVNAIAIGRWKA